MPRGREKNVTGQGKSVYKRGEGLGTGPVGSQNGYSGRNQAGGGPGNQRSGGSGNQRGSGPTRGGGKGGLIKIIIVIAALLAGGGGLSGILGGGGGNTPDPQPEVNDFKLGSISQLGSASSSKGWVSTANTGKLNTSVASGSRAKYTKLKGNSKDTVTVMVYMCGADLESQSGLGTADLQEMINATVGSKVNLLIYMGGTTRWHISGLSTNNNYIIKIENGSMYKIATESSLTMTDPATLTGFINYCSKNYPADRYQLILWDHGSGTLSGYGYDEKHSNSGSMGLAQIDKALTNAGIKFDFVGFDACLMATAETGIMLAPHADYMIASEEVEAGYGWYYTNWLTSLSKNTSISTLELGKQIVDDFVDSCAQQTPGQKATLSLTDLAELSATLPDALSGFSTSTCDLIKENYRTVADARSSCREFSTSSIDQVDLVNLALNVKTNEGNALANAVLGAVKYNRCSTNMTNAYGLSIYFPYKKATKVNTAVNTYKAIGLSDEYSRCIQEFAGVTGSGQSVQSSSYTGSTGGAQYVLPNLSSFLGSMTGGTTSGGTVIGNGGATVGQSGSFNSIDLISSLLNAILSNRSGITDREVLDIVENNSFNAENLIWTKGSKGWQIQLGNSQWELVRDLKLNVFYDDGSGYIDLGMDNVYEISDEGALISQFDGTWLAIDDQPVAYYYMDTVDDGTNYTITGRVPVLLNGNRADLILVFDNDNPYGYVAGAAMDYRDGQTDTLAKLVPVNTGDTLDFLCDYYNYSGEYEDSYMLGDSMTVKGNLTVSNVYLPDPSSAEASYVFTDIFAQDYWTPVIPE